MYKKLLIALDMADDNREQLLAKAYGIITQLNADYEIVYCLQQTFVAFAEFPVSLPPVNMEIIRQEIQPHFDEIISNSGLSSNKAHIEIAFAEDFIVNKANSEGFDAIITGSHGKHGLGLLLGSTCNAILHHADCDVIALRLDTQKD